MKIATETTDARIPMEGFMAGPLDSLSPHSPSKTGVDAHSPGRGSG
jgi:hypothetical protein